MRTSPVLFAAACAMLLIAGCKSSPVSRTYDGTYDQVWQSALLAAADVTGKAPAYSDKDSGKIITEWTQGNVATEEGNPASEKRSVDIWRGIVQVQKDIAGTKVTVRLDKGSYGAEKPRADNGAQDASVNVSLWSNDKEPQKMYLNQVTEELIKIKYRKKRS